MGNLLAKGVEYEADGSTIKRCLFCDICSDQPKARQTEVAFEDETVVVFAPLGMCARQHWLVVPRAHIRNATTLQSKDLPLLKYMREVGEKVLKEKQQQEGGGSGEDGAQFQYCFHVEPFNSIAHLHLRKFMSVFSVCVYLHRVILLFIF